MSSRAIRSAEQYKEIVERIHAEAFSEGEYDVLDEVFAEDFVQHGPGTGVEYHGAEEVKEMIDMYRSAFPDLTFTNDEIIVEGDTLAVRYTASGTHEGEFQGVEPTGETVELTNTTFVHFEDGKLSEVWPCVDQLGLMQQLGAIPEPSA